MYMTLHHTSRDNMKQHDASPAKQSYLCYLSRLTAALNMTRQLAEMACWLEWRCPALWQLAGEAIEARMPVRPSWATLRGGQFIEALKLGGLMAPGLAAEALRPFAELEAVRSAYVANARTFSASRSPLAIVGDRISLNDKTSSDCRSERFGALRARRAAFFAKGRGRPAGDADATGEGGTDDAGAPEPTAARRSTLRTPTASSGRGAHAGRAH